MKEPRYIPLLSRAYNVKPDTEGLPTLLAQLLVKENRTEAEHQGLFVNLFNNDPSNSAWGIQLAKIHMAQDQFDAMAKVLESIPNPNAHKSEIQRLLATARASLREFEKAVDHYRSILELHPRDRDATMGLGRAYSRMEERSPEMYEAIERAQALSHDDPLLNYALGQRAATANKWGDASRLFSIAGRGGQEYVDLVWNYLALLVKTLENSQSIPARWLQVQVLLNMKRFEEVVEATEAIYEIDSRGKHPHPLCLRPHSPDRRQ